jgi:hypothetical protein
MAAASLEKEVSHLVRDTEDVIGKSQEGTVSVNDVRNLLHFSFTLSSRISLQTEQGPNSSARTMSNQLQVRVKRTMASLQLLSFLLPLRNFLVNKNGRLTVFQTSSLANLLLTAQKSNSINTSTAWPEDFSLLNFLSSVTGDSDDDVERSKRILLFTTIYVLSLLQMKDKLEGLSQYIDVPTSVATCASAFAALEPNKLPTDTSKWATDLARTPLNVAFPYALRSSLDSDSFFTFNFLLKKAEAAGEKYCKVLAWAALQLRGDVFPESHHQVRSLVRASLLAGSDLNAVLAMSRTYCDLKPKTWRDEAIKAIVENAVKSNRLDALMFTPTEKLIVEPKLASLVSPDFVFRKLIVERRFFEAAKRSKVDVSSLNLLRSCEETVPKYLFKSDGSTREYTDVGMTLTSAFDQRLESQSETFEILESLSKQPKLASLSSNIFQPSLSTMKKEEKNYSAAAVSISHKIKTSTSKQREVSVTGIKGRLKLREKS